MRTATAAAAILLASTLVATAAHAATITEIPVQETGLEGPNRIAFAADGSAWATFGTFAPDSTRMLRLDPRTGRVLGRVDGLPGIPVDLAAGSDGLVYATSKSAPWGDVGQPSHITAFNPDGSVAGSLAEKRILSGVAPAPGGGAFVGSYELYVTGFTSGDQVLSRWAPGAAAMTTVQHLPARPNGWSTGAHRIQTLADGTTWFLEHHYDADRPIGAGGTLAGDERLGRIDAAGNTTLRDLVQEAFVDDFAVARDGSVWFVIRRNTAVGESAQTLGRFDPASGELREQPLPVDGFGPRLASVPDGDVWLASGSAVVRIDPTTSATTVLPLPTGSLAAESPIAGDIVNGPDGALWITDANGALARVDPSDDGTAVGALATAARAGVNALVRCRKACRARATVSAALPPRGNARRATAARARRVVLGRRTVRLRKRGAQVTRVKTDRRHRAQLLKRRRVNVTVKVRVRERGGRVKTRRTRVVLRRF